MGAPIVNVAQACRQALLDIDAVKRDGTSTPLYTTAELLAWANEAKDKIEKALRTNDQDYNLVIRNSTDADLRWEGMNYDPSDFGLTTTARSYILPPDMLLMRRIRCITTGEENRQFRHVDLSHPDFVAGEQTASDATTSGEIMWDIVGERTLRIHNPPDTALDIELAYVPRSRKLQMYTTGTITVTIDTATVTGSSSLWVDDNVNAFAELIGGTSATSTPPQVTSQTSTDPFVNPSRFYNAVSAISSDTALTLIGNWLTTTLAAGTGYMIASRFPFPVEHAFLVSDWVAYRALKKARSADQTAFKGGFDEGIRELIPDTAERQSADPVFVEDMTFD
jgi:hypothetical protein